MVKMDRSKFFGGVLVGVLLVWLLSLTAGMVSDIGPKPAQAKEAKPKGMFVNLVNFPPVKPGKDAEFLEWFRWSNEVYAKHTGFISRTLLKSTDSRPTYAAIVEHESKETFMAMHNSQDRAEAFKRVGPLLDGRPTPHFYEVVVAYAR